jgi:putative sigma-54 modulation protein
MKIDYTGRGTEVTAGLKEALEKRLDKLTSRVGEFDGVHAIFSVQKQRQKVELIIKARRKKYICKGESGDMYASIDAAGDALMHELSKVKDVARNRHRHAGSRRRPAGAAGEAAPPADAEPAVTRVTQPALKPMSLKMATLMLAAQAEPVLVYTSTDSGRLAVLFRRPGGIGLIEP